MKRRQPGSVFDALARFFTQIGEAEGAPGRGLAIAAEFEGKSHFTLTHEIDPDDRKHRLSLLSASRIAGRYRVPALAEYFATLAGGTFMPLPRPGLDPLWGELTAKAVEDMGAFAAEVVRDMGDGRVDRVEAGRMVPRLDEIQRHIASIRGLAVAVATGEVAPIEVPAPSEGAGGDDV